MTATAIPAEASRALVEAKRRVRGIDGLRGVDFGYVYKKGRRTDATGIRFHVDRKVRRNKLTFDQLLPATIGGIEVDVLGVGYAPHGNGARTPQAELESGISVGNRKLRTTGTLGSIVRDDVTGASCLLSNWHVLCGGPEAVAGDEITQPGPMDWPNGPTVALLSRWLRLDQQYDAAIARLNPGVAASDTVFGTQLAVTGFKSPEVGMRLQKSGAVSGMTRALVDGVGGSYSLDYEQYGFPVKWMQGFHLVPDDEAPGLVSLPGDSGSVWLDPSDRAAVGLHFAGEDGESPLNDYGLAHPIAEILGQLNISLITGRS